MIKRFSLAAHRNPLMVANPSRKSKSGRKGRKAHKGGLLSKTLRTLRNPADIRIPGMAVDVLPLAGGVVGAVAIYEIVEAIPALRDLGGAGSIISKLVKPVAAIGAGWATAKYLGPKHKAFKAVGPQIAALGLAFGIKDAVQGKAREGVEYIAAKIQGASAPAQAALPAVPAAVPAGAAAAAGFAGGAFSRVLSGGTFLPAKPGAPYTPAPGTDLSGFVMNGGTFGKPGIRAAGASALAGIDMADFGE